MSYLPTPPLSPTSPAFDLEPIDIVFDSKEVTSSNNVTGSRDNPIFTIEPPIPDCVGVSLLYANVPFTYYVIDHTNNKFSITIKSNNGASTATNVTCSIAPGTYNIQNIGSQIVAAILASGASGVTSANIDVFVDNTDMRLVIYRADNSTGSADEFTLNFNVTNSVAEVLGFAETSYTSTLKTDLFSNQEVAITSHSIKGPRVVNLTGPAQMFLSSDFGSSLYGKVRNQKATEPLVSFWPVNSNYTGTIDIFLENPMRRPISSTTVTKCSFGLLLGNRTRYNNDGTVDSPYLQLNGEAFQVALRFYRLIPLDRPTIDAAGNSTTSSFAMKGSVFNPASFTQQDVFKRQRLVKR